MSGKNGNGSRGRVDRRFGKRHGDGIREFKGKFYVVPNGPNGSVSHRQELRLLGLHHSDAPAAWTIEERRYSQFREPGYVGRYRI